MLVPCHRHRSAAFSREFGCLKKYFCLLLTADDENPTSCFNDVNYSHFISTIHLPEQQSSISVWDAGCVMGSQWSSKHCPAYDSQSSCPKSPPSSAPGVAVGERWRAAPQEGPVRSHQLLAKRPQHSRQLRSVRANTSSQNFIL